MKSKPWLFINLKKRTKFYCLLSSKAFHLFSVGNDRYCEFQDKFKTNNTHFMKMLHLSHLLSRGCIKFYCCLHKLSIFIVQRGVGIEFHRLSSGDIRSSLLAMLYHIIQRSNPQPIWGLAIISHIQIMTDPAQQALLLPVSGYKTDP